MDLSNVKERLSELWSNLKQWASDNPIKAIIAGVVSSAIVAGSIAIPLMGGDKEPELGEPKVQVQGDNGSSVVTGGGELNAAEVETFTPQIEPPPLHIPQEEVKPEEIDIPEPPPPEIVDPKGEENNGQVVVPKFIPGEGADKVDTRPRPAPKPQEKPKPQEESLANTIEIKGQRLPTVPSGDNGVDTFIPPENPALTGWWQNSAEPGTDEPGSVVMSGHIDNNGVPGVGKIYSSLNEGDKIVTWNTKGKRSEWMVTSKIVSPKEGQMDESVNRSTGPQTLVLVTCGGEYIGAPLYYESNVIIEAVPA